MYMYKTSHLDLVTVAEPEYIARRERRGLGTTVVEESPVCAAAAMSVRGWFKVFNFRTVHQF